MGEQDDADDEQTDVYGLEEGFTTQAAVDEAAEQSADDGGGQRDEEEMGDGVRPEAGEMKADG